MAHFQHDCETKDLPDTGHGEEFYELLSDLELSGNNKGSQGPTQPHQGFWEAGNRQ
jgi:hypothetical protein